MENQIETNLSRVRLCLMGGAKLTVLTAIKYCRTVDLRKYISMLKREGLDIISEPTFNANKKRFNTYYLRIVK